MEEGGIGLRGARPGRLSRPGLAILLALPLLAGAGRSTSVVTPSVARAVMTASVATTAVASASKGTRAAPLAVASLDEIRREIANRRGAPLLVNFWASWCDPCVEELPDMAKIELRFASRGIRVIGVSCDLFVEDDSRALRRKVASVLSKARVVYPNFLYQGREDPLMNAFNLPGSIPLSILYDARGAEVRRWEGRMTAEDLEQELGSR